jgi:hypothetical protein
MKLRIKGLYVLLAVVVLLYSAKMFGRQRVDNGFMRVEEHVAGMVA